MYFYFFRHKIFPRREKLYALILSVVLGIFGTDWFYLCVTRLILMKMSSNMLITMTLIEMILLVLMIMIIMNMVITMRMTN